MARRRHDSQPRETSGGGRIPPAALGNLGTPILFGAILSIDHHNETRYYNRGILVNGAGEILGTYDKMVLVPFGEYIPFGETFPWLYSWSPYSSQFWSGDNSEPLLLGTHPISLSICYEDIFPEQIRLLMSGGQEARIPEANVQPNGRFLVWQYGRTNEHLVLASFRAIEHRRSLVRSTTTGIPQSLNPVGRFHQAHRAMDKRDAWSVGFQ